jgi:glycosyltransferase involved in cell wall biosynthesis
MKTKVLFFVSTLESGGPTNVIYNIIRYLDRATVEPVILTLSPEPSRSRKGDFEDLGVSIHQFNQSRVSWIISGGKALRQYIANIEPHIIHSHSLRPDIFSAKHLEGYIRISTLHANLKDNYINTYNRPIGDYFAYTQIKHVNHLEKVVACSKSVYEVYKNKVDSIDFIPNGVDAAIFKPLSPEAITQKRSELNLPANKKIFISVGSLCARKDPHTLIKGFLSSEHKNDSILLMLGTGELETELKSTYTSENILFKGYIKDVVAYLEVSDFFMSASWSEGLPNTVMEALGCGLPTCLSDIAAHHEILSINPDAGIIFKCGDHEGLSNSINTLMKKEYTSLRKAAVSIIEQELSAKKMAASYQKLYLSMYNP